MKKGYFGDFGGQFVPELLMPPLLELETVLNEVVRTDAFRDRLAEELRDYVGRPSALTRCPTLSERTGVDIWLKREDLNHSGSHKINNTIGQGLLTKMIGKEVLMAETGAGQHGVATATAAARFGLSCVVFMGALDVERQSHNVHRMKLLGAEVVAVESGTRTLKDAINAALRYWIAEQRSAHYCFGTAAGPHPFPELVHEFQAVISREARAQFLERAGRLPHAVVACVGGGSNAIGMFHEFLPDREVRLIGVEAGGSGEPGCFNSAPLNLGTPGVLHGMHTQLLQTKEGQILPSHSIAPGLDYPGVGPEHSALQASGRAEYGLVNDAQALAAFQALTLSEGILPALESCHALAWVLENAASLKGQSVIVCLSGRGDKDLDIVEQNLG
ncbi:MAG TPA: tryptophan synthase subunit beta [Desulfovibrio sp.]|uniref:tryptophan synthase subunit beta n=1 Tax=Desulfovibrio TaxID=872 RepID=UPI000429A6C6|nr:MULTISPECIES: tryptophan synthase subunit beta [Desulfovibrio]MDY0305525.1 tryptophan synthase subunit beta [Desulfovibrionaceae bacterium]HMM38763.1 tryptophan synthase subunit beta [Desulfovibrio sp.]